MSRGVKLGRRGLIAAAVTAGGVLATVLVQNALQSLVSLASYGRFEGALGIVIEGAWTAALTASVPLSIGVFLSLWQLAPIGAELRLGHVVTRALLATAVGAVIAFVVSSVIVLVQTVTSAASEVATRGVFELSSLSPGLGILGAVTTAATAFIASVPLVVLACVLLWLWLRDHDREYPVEGMLDL